MQLERYTNKRL